MAEKLALSKLEEEASQLVSQLKTLSQAVGAYSSARKSFDELIPELKQIIIKTQELVEISFISAQATSEIGVLQIDTRLSRILETINLLESSNEGSNKLMIGKIETVHEETTNKIETIEQGIIKNIESTGAQLDVKLSSISEELGALEISQASGNKSIIGKAETVGKDIITRLGTLEKAQKSSRKLYIACLVGVVIIILLQVLIMIPK